MTVTGSTIAAVMPQTMADPQPPRSTTEKPSEPSRKPGFARQMTNPSYHRSVFRSWRSSTTASATFPPSSAIPAPPRQYRAAPSKVTPVGRTFNARGAVRAPSAYNRARVAPATDHRHVRLRREQGRRLRRSLAVRVRSLVEHRADPGRGVRGPPSPHEAARGRGGRDGGG